MYQKIGYYKVDQLQRFIGACNALQGAQANSITAGLKQAFEAAGFVASSARFTVMTLSQQQRLTQTLRAVTEPGILSASDFETVVIWLLHECGRVRELPDEYTRRLDASMTLQELMNKIIISRFDTVRSRIKTDLLPNVAVPIMYADVATAVYTLLEQVSSWRDMQRPLEDRMFAYLTHLKYQLKTGQQLVGLDKSFYLHATHPNYGYLGDGTPKNPYRRIYESLAEVEARENPDPLVAQFGEAMKAVCEPGMKADFCPIISNGALTNLIIFVGPVPPNVKMAAGTKVEFAPFSDLKLTEIDPGLRITQDELLLGIINAQASARTSEYSPAGMQGVSQRFLMHSASVPLNTGEYGPIPMIYDMPEISLVWRRDGVKYSYYSDLAERDLITDEPAGLLVELARKHRIYGGTKVGDMLLTGAVSGLVQVLSAPYQRSDNINDTQPLLLPLTSETFKLTVCYRRATMSQDVKPLRADVDLTPYFAQYGNIFLQPLGLQLIQTSLNLLETPQGALVEYIARNIPGGLSALDFHINQRAFTVLANCFLLKLIGARLPAFHALRDAEAQDPIAYASTLLYSV